MRKLSLLLMLCLLVTACMKSQPPVTYQCPRVVLPDDPKNNLATLTEESTPDQVIKAWVATAVAYRNWNHAVREQVQDSR